MSDIISSEDGVLLADVVEVIVAGVPVDVFADARRRIEGGSTLGVGGPSIGSIAGVADQPGQVLVVELGLGLVDGVGVLFGLLHSNPGQSVQGAFFLENRVEFFTAVDGDQAGSHSGTFVLCLLEAGRVVAYHKVAGGVIADPAIVTLDVLKFRNYGGRRRGNSQGQRRRPGGKEGELPGREEELGHRPGDSHREEEDRPGGRER